MAGHVQVESLPSNVLAVEVAPRRTSWFAAACLCLFSAWYFALVIAPSGLGPSSPTFQQGLLPEWIGCREVLRGRDPYRAEVMRQAQSGIYGQNGPIGAAPNQHRFAYPAFFVFLFFPIALLPLEIAQLVMLAVCVLLWTLSLRLWLSMADFHELDRLTFAVLAFASYPVILALQLRQPTLMIFAMLSLAVFWARSGRLVWAGIAGALGTCKPHLAIAVLLPLTIWSLVSWRTRKAFLLSLSATLFALLMASSLLVPGWLFEWLGTLRAYTRYAGATPLFAELLQGHFVFPAAALLVLAIVWMSFAFCDEDLLFAISFSVVAFQMLFQFQIYNEVLLLPATLWAAINAAVIRRRGQLPDLLSDCAWTALGSGWAATVALSAWDMASPGSGVKLWQLPLIAAWLYPMLLFAALAVFAASSLLARYRAQRADRITA